MEDPQRILVCRAVVAQDQVELKVLSPHSGDGRDGVVGCPVRRGQNACALIGISPPAAEDPVRQVYDPLRVPSVQTDDGHGPVDDPGADIGIIIEPDCLPAACLCHGEGVIAALVVLMSQDGASDNGQVGVGSDRVVGELLHKLEESDKGIALDLHGPVLSGQNDAVLIVIDIGRILHVPLLSREGQRDQADILAGRMVQPSGIAHILAAEQASGIGGPLLLGQGRGDGFGILFRLGEVDRDIQIPVAGGGDPLPVPDDAVAADVIAVPAELVEIVRRLPGGPPVVVRKGPDDLRGPGSQDTHHPGVKKVPAGDPVLDHAAGDGLVQQGLQDLLQVRAGIPPGLLRILRPAADGRPVCRILCHRGAGQEVLRPCLLERHVISGRIRLQKVKKTVGRKDRVLFSDQTCPEPVADQRGHGTCAAGSVLRARENLFFILAHSSPPFL